MVGLASSTPSSRGRRVLVLVLVLQMIVLLIRADPSFAHAAAGALLGQAVGEKDEGSEGLESAAHGGAAAAAGDDSTWFPVQLFGLGVFSSCVAGWPSVKTAAPSRVCDWARVPTLGKASNDDVRVGCCWQLPVADARWAARGDATGSRRGAGSRVGQGVWAVITLDSKLRVGCGYHLHFHSLLSPRRSRQINSSRSSVVTSRIR